MKIEEGEGFVVEWLYRVDGRELSDIVSLIGGVSGDGTGAHVVPCLIQGDRLVPVNGYDYTLASVRPIHFPIGIMSVVGPSVNGYGVKIEDGRSVAGALLGVAKVFPAVPKVEVVSRGPADTRPDAVYARYGKHKIKTYNMGGWEPKREEEPKIEEPPPPVHFFHGEQRDLRAGYPCGSSRYHDVNKHWTTLIHDVTCVLCLDIISKVTHCGRDKTAIALCDGAHDYKAPNVSPNPLEATCPSCQLLSGLVPFTVGSIIETARGDNTDYGADGWAKMRPWIREIYRKDREGKIAKGERVTPVT